MGYGIEARNTAYVAPWRDRVRGCRVGRGWHAGAADAGGQAWTSPAPPPPPRERMTCEPQRGSKPFSTRSEDRVPLEHCRLRVITQFLARRHGHSGDLGAPGVGRSTAPRPEAAFQNDVGERLSRVDLQGSAFELGHADTRQSAQSLPIRQVSVARRANVHGIVGTVGGPGLAIGQRTKRCAQLDYSLMAALRFSK